MRNSGRLNGKHWAEYLSEPATCECNDQYSRSIHGLLTHSPSWDVPLPSCHRYRQVRVYHRYIQQSTESVGVCVSNLNDGLLWMALTKPSLSFWVAEPRHSLHERVSFEPTFNYDYDEVGKVAIWYRRKWRTHKTCEPCLSMHL